MKPVIPDDDNPNPGDLSRDELTQLGAGEIMGVVGHRRNGQAGRQLTVSAGRIAAYDAEEDEAVRENCITICRGDPIPRRETKGATP